MSIKIKKNNEQGSNGCINFFYQKDVSIKIMYVEIGHFALPIRMMCHFHHSEKIIYRVYNVVPFVLSYVAGSMETVIEN